MHQLTWMLSLTSSHRYYLYPKPCDMRKSFDSLSGIVRTELGKDPANGAVFLFLNKPRNRLKLLHWESGGFVLYYKRLEKGTFAPPVQKEGGDSVSWPELVLMIEGVQVLKSLQKPRYQR